MVGSALVQHIGALSGLSDVFAVSVVKRSCDRAGLDPTKLRVQDFPVLEAQLGPAMGVFLEKNAVAQGLERIKAGLAALPKT